MSDFSIFHNRDHLRHLGSFLKLTDQAWRLASIDRPISLLIDQSTCYDYDKLVWSPSILPPTKVFDKVKHIQWSSNYGPFANEDIESIVKDRLKQLASSNNFESFFILNDDMKYVGNKFLEAFQEINPSDHQLRKFYWHNDMRLGLNNSSTKAFTSFNKFVNLDELTIKCHLVHPDLMTSLIRSLPSSLKHICISSGLDDGMDGELEPLLDVWQTQFKDPNFLPRLETWLMPRVIALPEALMTTLIPPSIHPIMNQATNQSPRVRPIRCFRIGPDLVDGSIQSINPSMGMVNFVGLTALFVKVNSYSEFNDLPKGSLPQLRLFDLRWDGDLNDQTSLSMGLLMSFLSKRPIEHLTLSPFAAMNDVAIQQFSQMSHLRYLEIDAVDQLFAPSDRQPSQLISAGCFPQLTCLKGQIPINDMMMLLPACPSLRSLTSRCEGGPALLPLLNHFCPLIQSITIQTTGYDELDVLTLLQQHVNRYPLSPNSFSQLLHVDIEHAMRQWPAELFCRVMCLLKRAPNLTLFPFSRGLVGAGSGMLDLWIARDLACVRELTSYSSSFGEPSSPSDLYLQKVHHQQSISHLAHGQNDTTSPKRRKTDQQDMFRFVDAISLVSSKNDAGHSEMFPWAKVWSVDQMNNVLFKLSQPLAEADLMAKMHVGQCGYYQFRQAKSAETGLDGREEYLIAMRSALSESDKELLAKWDKSSSNMMN